VVKKSVFTKVLALIGAVLVWFPILAPVLFSAIVSIRSGRFHFDYLMPAELFAVALTGAALLLWAALRAHSRRRLIAWGLGTAVVMLVGGQALAVATGIASSETDPEGLILGLVIGSIAIYTMALVEIGVAGIYLLRDLFKFPVEGVQSL
jgi:hypothetical protein